MARRSETPRLLFAAFEPSGDALAAEVIAATRRHAPRLEVHALGGPRMAAAGASLLEETTGHSGMLLEPLAQARAHQRRLRRLRSWLADHDLDAFVPVDSPAANWSICRAVRRRRPEAAIVHLVAPQLWAWASWRIRRLRRLTDQVACLLPFEPPWLARRGVPATFVGHPAFDPGPPPDPAGLPEGRPRLALLPGSRRGEVTRNWPTMLEAFMTLKRDRPGLHGVVAVLDEAAAGLVRDLTPGAWPRDLLLVPGRAPDVLDWCDAALVVSGTVTLQAAARATPMVVMYNTSRLPVLLLRRLVRTRTFALPNIVAEWAGAGRAVPELVPHFGEVAPVVRELRRLLDDPEAAARQRRCLAEVAARCAGPGFAEAAARILLDRVGEAPSPPPARGPGRVRSLPGAPPRRREHRRSGSPPRGPAR